MLHVIKGSSKIILKTFFLKLSYHLILPTEVRHALAQLKQIKTTINKQMVIVPEHF